ncbi:hypothetical protein CDL10_02030 [Avrilella dinanensis]|uniref:Uncharacterized protein n=1 Tax=Avrilella dinanensis TaxID=2008672 RepID=A0A2M9R3I5_9FLAO|nr:hypothetical protein CDL10_02030 [Avrilella dinanensis]
MFTTGRIVFSLLFVIVFIAVVAYMYRKDLKIHQIYYKNTKWILIAIFSFIGILFLIKMWLKQ